MSVPEGALVRSLTLTEEEWWDLRGRVIGMRRPCVCGAEAFNRDLDVLIEMLGFVGGIPA